MMRFRKRIYDEAKYLIKKNGNASSHQIVQSAIERNPKWVRWMPKAATISAWMKTSGEFKSVSRRNKGRTVRVWILK